MLEIGSATIQLAVMVGSVRGVESSCLAGGAMASKDAQTHGPKGV